MNKLKTPRTYGDIITINVDVQNDFALPTGALSVPDGEAVISPLNNINDWTRENGGQVVLTRDWHPVDTAHFSTHGGSWPPHCIQQRAGAAFHDDLIIKDDDNIGSKGMSKTDDGYSGWYAEFSSNRYQDTFYLDDIGSREDHSYNTIPGRLAYDAYHRGSRDTSDKPLIAVLVGGLATDYCVKATVMDALSERISADVRRSKIGKRMVDVYLLTDAIRAVNIQPDDGEKAIATMIEAGAIPTTTEQIINGGLALDDSLLMNVPHKRQPGEVRW